MILYSYIMGEFQDTAYLIGIVPTIIVANFGSGGGNVISKFPTIRVFLLMEFTLWLIIVTTFFLGK